MITQAVAGQRFIGLLLDETTDSANICQLVVHYRFALYGKIYTSFGGMIPLGVKKDQETVTAAVEKYIQGKRCVFLLIVTATFYI